MANDYVFLFHGSDCIVNNPNLKMCKKGKDFGQGFYLTTDKEQAIKFAKIVARRNGKAKGYVNIYKLYPFKGITRFIFKTTDIAWLNCVVGNRDTRYSSLKKEWDSYDMIIGKIADDDTAQVINAYMSGAYGEISSQEAIKFAIKMFKPDNLKDQMCLKTVKALSFIEFDGYFEVNL